MGTLQTASVSFALSQVFLSLLLLNTKKWSIQRRLYAALLVAVTAYLVLPLVNDPSLWSWLASVSTAGPGLFWLTCASFFNDHFQLKRWQIGLVAVTVILPLVGRLFEYIELTSPYWLTYVLPQGLEFVLLGLALYAVAQHWHGDLIERRRRLRLWFCSLNGVYIFVLLLFREVLFADADWLRGFQYIPVGFTLLATNALLLGYEAGVLDEAEEQLEPDKNVFDSDTKIAPEVDGELINKLREVVGGVQADGSDGAFREMGLTIGQLAHRLAVPEYKVRQAINQGMNYRNFNDFLNSYRIREASQRLAKVSDSHLPVLTIALDAGFRSLSSFNKAFKAEFQTTPTAYRKQNLAD